MVIKDNLEFHAAELRKAHGVDGWLLTRIPADISNQINTRGKFVAVNSVTTEIRFVTDAPNTRLTLSAIQPEFGLDQMEIQVYYGDYNYQSYWLKPGVVTTIMISPPPNFRNIKDEYLRRGPGIGFAPNVCRVVAQSGGLIYCGIETFGSEVRPPEAEEKPAKSCLFYGSSITNSTLDGYPSVACQRLGMDCINIGLSGACCVEPVLVDWLVARDDWDVAVFELGINALFAMEPEEFRNRVDHLLDVFTAQHPTKPMVMITIYPSHFRTEIMKKPYDDDRDAKFCAILRELYAKYKDRANLHLVEGDEIVDDINILGGDYLHPKRFGHAVMGLNLVEKLKPLVRSRR